MTTLDELLRPLEAGHFLHTCFGKSAALFKPAHALQWRDEWKGDVWQSLPALRHVDAATRDAEGQHQQERIATGDIASALASGATICGDITLHPPVLEWLHALSRSLGVGKGGFAKLYVSPQGVGFPLHFDPHHVFVLQCRGSKRWRYGATASLPNASHNAKVNARGEAVFSGRFEGLPLRGDQGALAAPSDSEMREVVLEPGDALYLPPGTWHAASALEESVAISVSPPRVQVFDLLGEYLESRALVTSSWRSDLSIAKTPIHGQPIGLVAERLQQTANELADALKNLDFELLARQWVARVSTDLVASPDHAPIRKETRLERAGPFPYLELDSSFVFYSGGEELSLPLEARPFVEGLASAPVFEAREVLVWDSNLRWRDARKLLEELVVAGLLRVVSVP